MPKFYFTFGFGQVHENGYYIVSARDRPTARKEMGEKFGSRWAFQYDEEQWVDKNGQSQAEEYNLHEVK